MGWFPRGILLDIFGILETADDNRTFCQVGNLEASWMERKHRLICLVSGSFWSDADMDLVICEVGDGLFDGGDGLSRIISVDWNKACMMDEWTGDWELHVLRFGDAYQWSIIDFADEDHLVEIGNMVINQ